VGGGGFHFSVSFGVGPGVAWFPLAPGEVFVPMYHTSRVYVTNVNVTNTVVNVARVNNVYNSYTTNNVTRINQVTYANQHVTNAVTAVSRDTFVNARPVARNAVQVPAQDIARAPVTHMAAVTPVRASVVGGGEHARAVPPSAVVNRQVVASHPVRVRIPASLSRPSGASTSAAQPVSRDARQVPRPSQPTQAPQQSAAARTYRRQGAPSYRPPAGTTGRQGQQARAPNPLVRPAPPVQPKSQQQWAKEESKYQTWQQQRQSAPRPPQSSPQQQHQQAPRQQGGGQGHGR
jgi:hypothetical protein